MMKPLSSFKGDSGSFPIPEARWKVVFDPLLLWRQLHDLPERSGREKRTAALLREAVSGARPDGAVVPLSGNTFVFITGSGEDRLLIRSDMDAVSLPGNKAAHLCGHDGHAAILVYVASLLAGRGRGVLFLFQGEEETGKGAFKAVRDLAEKKITFRGVLGFHNIPGYPPGSVLVKAGSFAQGSVGFSLHIKGETSHASEPQKGKNPALLLAELIRELPELPARLGLSPAMATVVHARLGEKAFGVTPGDALLLATLRSPSDTILEKLKEETALFCRDKTSAAGFPVSYRWQEYFPAVVNDKAMARAAEDALASSGHPVFPLENPFPWSEDFGWFSGKAPSLMVGLGSGEEQPPLHHPDYIFPGGLLETGARIIALLARSL